MVICSIGLYLVIGPFFALPRLATTSFEIAFSPFISSGTAQALLPILVFYFE